MGVLPGDPEHSVLVDHQVVVIAGGKGADLDVFRDQSGHTMLLKVVKFHALVHALSADIGGPVWFQDERDVFAAAHLFDKMNLARLVGKTLLDWLWLELIAAKL